jgi:hypothetical protein
VNPFHLAVKSVSGSAAVARPPEPVDQPPFRLTLRIGEPLTERRIAGQRCERTQLRQVGHPGVADRVGNQSSEGRVRHQQPASWRHTVGLVVESCRKHLGEVREHIASQQIGVNLRHPLVLCVPTTARSPSDLARRRFFDDAHALPARVAPGCLRPTSRKRQLIS